nr:unnamed protein product [Callosobruchus analis]
MTRATAEQLALRYQNSPFFVEVTMEEEVLFLHMNKF